MGRVLSKYKGPVARECLACWNQQRRQRGYRGVINGRAVGAEARELMQDVITQGLVGHCRDFGLVLCSAHSDLYLVVQDGCMSFWHSSQWQEEKENRRA